MKYIETTCFLIDSKLQDMGMDQEGTAIDYCLDIDSIESFRPSTTDNFKIEDKTLVMFKSGDSCIIGMTYKQLKKIVYESN